MAREAIPVTREGLERLKEELRGLKEVRRPRAIAAVAEARSHGDLRENAAYDAARNDQAMVEKRISDLETQLRSAVLIDEAAAGRRDIVNLGSTVVVDFEGDEETYTIVGPPEVALHAGRISYESPVGRALVGRRRGERVEAATLDGQARLEVVAVD